MNHDRNQEPPEFADHIEKLGADHPDLGRAFASFKGIDDVLRWMGSRARTDIDIVGMDEFHYDFLVRLDDSGRWLAFGVT
jgi:hypothetical protein